MDNQIKKDLENTENENKIDLDKPLKPQIPLKIKKQYVVITIFVVFVLFVYSFMKAATPRQKKAETAQQQEQSVTTLDDVSFSSNDILVEKENKVKKEEQLTTIVEKKEVPQDNVQQNNGLDQFILEQLQEEKEYLRAYYERLIQEEQDARTSSMSFKTMTSNNQNSSNSSLGGTETQIGNTGVNFAQEDQNKQAEKKAFLQAAEAAHYYNKHSLIDKISPYEIKAGNIIPGVMITATISDLPGYMLGQVRENIYDTVTGSILLIPKGTRIIGKYDSTVSFGQERILVVWQRLIFPNGKSLGLDNMPGTDMSGLAGFKDKVNNHFFKLLQAVVLSSFVGAGEAIITRDEYGEDDWRYEAGRGGGEVALEFGNKIADRVLAQQPTIEIPMGYRFNIIVNSDLILEPYNKE